MSYNTLSKRQYPLLQTFIHDSLSIDAAQAFDQRPFRSLLIRKYVEYKPGKGFHVTREGRDAWREFHNTDIIRKNPMLPLTAYFDPTAYGLEVKKRKPKAKVAKVHEMKRGAA